MFRRELVDRVARQTTGEVHAHNQIFSIANLLGYGTPLINNKDSYQGYVDRYEVILNLRQTFTERYHPFAMLLSLKHTLSTAFSYTGPKTTGYRLIESKTKPNDEDIEPGKLYFYKDNDLFYCAVNDDGVKRILITQEALGDSAEGINKLNKKDLGSRAK